MNRPGCDYCGESWPHVITLSRTYNDEKAVACICKFCLSEIFEYIKKVGLVA